MVKQAVIVAGGQGQRLGAAGQLMPKGLMTIAGQQLVPRSIELLRAVGIEQIIIGTGHLASQYADWFDGQADVVCVPHDRFAATSSMFTLYNARPYIRGDFLLLESDILYEPRALTEILGHPNETVVLVSQLTFAGDECYVGITESGHLTIISKQRADVQKLGGELAGITKISLAAFKNMSSFWEQNEAAFPKMNYEDALVGIAPHTLVMVHKAAGLVWCEIDTPEHRQRAETLIVPVLQQAENIKQVI